MCCGGSFGRPLLVRRLPRFHGWTFGRKPESQSGQRPSLCGRGPPGKSPAASDRSSGIGPMRGPGLDPYTSPSLGSLGSPRRARWVAYCAPVCLAATAQCRPNQSVTATSALGQVGAQACGVGPATACGAQPLVGRCAVEADAGGVGCAAAVWAVAEHQEARLAADVKSTRHRSSRRGRCCRRVRRGRPGGWHGWRRMSAAAVWVYTSCMPELHRRCRCGLGDLLAGGDGRAAGGSRGCQLVGEQRSCVAHIC